MPKNQLALPKAQKFRTIQELHKDTVTYTKYQNLIDEAVTCKSKIQLEQQNIKVLREAAAELGIKPALFNANVAMVFNNDYVQRKDNLEQQIELVETVMKDAGIEYDAGDEQDDDAE